MNQMELVLFISQFPSAWFPCRFPQAQEYAPACLGLLSLIPPVMAEEASGEWQMPLGDRLHGQSPFLSAPPALLDF